MNKQIKALRQTFFAGLRVWGTLNGFSILAAGSTGAGCEDVLLDDGVKLNDIKDRVFDFFQSCGDILYKTNFFFNVSNLNIYKFCTKNQN